MPALIVRYVGKMNPKLDSELRKAIESHGYQWYAEGYSFQLDERDICFLKDNDELSLKLKENNAIHRR